MSVGCRVDLTDQPSTICRQPFRNHHEYMSKAERITAMEASAGLMPNQCVPQLVSLQGALRPAAKAIRYGNLIVTYEELDKRASQLAHVLRSLGVRPDVAVGLYLDRSPAMVVGALAILKAGGAYLPLDPAYPKERLEFVLHDAGLRIMVTGDFLLNHLPIQPEHIIALDIEGRLPVTSLSESITVPVEPENLAYVIYTSGSTGQPKGVELTHGGLHNLVRWHQRAFNVSANERASQLAALSFDAAVWEIWPYLSSGSSLDLFDSGPINDPVEIRDWLLNREITICFLPTPLAEQVMRLEWPSNSTLRVMLTGADTLHHYPSRKLPFQLVNNYGPTECTVVATSGPVFPEERPERLPTIGRAIDNTTIRILNESKHEVPIGEIGEIYIGGAGLARGYRNRPDLTLEKFIADPFCAEPGARLYQTGDLARYLPDGQIAFVGRRDEQVKIRGFRIEPAEIVSVLNEHPAVEASAVAAREIEAGDKHLVAYLVLQQGARPTRTEMREFAATHLPEHMVPSVFVTLLDLPLNHSGKVDLKLLPYPNTDNSLGDEVFIPPGNPLEDRLASIVARLLGMERVSVEDNFFLLGGRSLLGTQLIASISDNFGVEVPLRTLFELPTIRAQAAEIERLLTAKVQAMSEDDAQRALASLSDRDRRAMPLSTKAA